MKSESAFALNSDEMISGLHIRITDCIVKSVPRRKHRKRRINKKYLKRYGYKTVPDDERVIVFGNYIYMTQGAYDQYIDQMKELSGGK